MAGFAVIRATAEHLVALAPDEMSAELKRLEKADPRLAAEVRDLLRMAEEAEDIGFLEGTAIGSGHPEVDRSGDMAPPEIDGYTVLQRLGSGSSGTVYCASAGAPLNRSVAIKVLHGGVSEAAEARFAREQQVLARLRHNGIAQVYDAGTTRDGRPFVVVELIEGLPITAHATSCGLSASDRIRLLIAVCEALHFVHLNGIIHRDLKPENILVDATHGLAVPKVIDFGSSSIVNGDPDTSTLGTQLVGTLAYMAPEQLSESERGDVRSDVFSLGVIAYELLSDAHPFGGRLEPIGKTVRAIQERALPALPTSLPYRAALTSVLGTACAKDSAARYPSAQHFADDLVRVLEQRPVLASSPKLMSHVNSAARRHPWLTAASIVGASVLLGLGVALAVSADRNSRQALTMRSTVEALVDDVLDEINEVSGTHEARERLSNLLLRRLDAIPVSERDEGYHLRLARVRSALSGVVLERQDVERAVRMRTETLREFEAFFRSVPMSQHARIEHVRITVLLGDAYADGGRSDEAFATYLAAHALIENALELDPTSTAWRDDLCWSYERLAWLSEPERPREALRLCEERLQIARQLHLEDTGSTMRLFGLGCAESWLGRVLARMGDDDEALPMHDAAVANLARCVEIEPSRFAFRSRLIIAQNARLESLLAIGSPLASEVALVLLREARDFYAENPQSRIARSALERALITVILAPAEVASPEHAAMLDAELVELGHASVFAGRADQQR